MKKQKKLLTQLGKILLILLMLFSQINVPIVAMAEELEDTTETKETPTSEENNTQEDINSPTDDIQEEVSPPEESPKYIITINGEEKTSYNIEKGNPKVTIVQSYNGEEGTYKYSNGKETEEIDFTSKLYGTYNFSYSVLTNNDDVIETKEIEITYDGDNNEILQKFIKNATIEDKTITFNNITKNLTVEEVLNYFDNESLQNQYNAKIVLTDQSENAPEQNSEINSNTKIILTNDIIEENYTIKIEGDFNNDNILDKEDSKIIIDKIVDENEKDENNNPIFTIMDATKPIYIINSSQQVEANDTLTCSLENKTEIYIDDELEVTLYIEGFDKDKLTGIEGIINYNDKILSLENIEISDKDAYGKFNTENNEKIFAYLLNDFNSEESLMTLKFKAISAGETDVSLEKIIGAYLGTQLNLEDSISTNITVLEYGKGGDEDQQEEQTKEESKPATIPQQTTTTYSNIVTTTPYIRRIALSSDSLIKLLEIKGYEIDFEPNKHNYKIKVKNNVNSLDLNIVLNDPNATYKVTGNENFKVGENTVEITVTAEDGTTSTYTIEVEKEKESKKAEKKEKEENSNSSKAIIIGLIVLTIIGLIYVIFKDDEEEDNKKRKPKKKNK